MKVYNCAPLPFMGQKRRFVRDFKEVLNGLNDAQVIVDLFGGSGLLSHVAKRMLPNVKVVYNDFDNFEQRLKNVETTNKILSDVRTLLSGIEANKRVPENIRADILTLIAEYESKGYVDYITLGSSLLFSGKWAWNFKELSRHTMYNVCKLSDYVVDGYLDGLEVVHCDYKKLYDRFKNVPGVVFLIDPPYLSTEIGQYECFWRLKDYLDVLKVLEGSRYIYFTSNKSQIIELCEWMKDNPLIGDPFDGAEVRKMCNSINYGTSFTDIMLIKK